jgi:hypothetical protein
MTRSKLWLLVAVLGLSAVGCGDGSDDCEEDCEDVEPAPDAGRQVPRGGHFLPYQPDAGR